MSQIDRSKMLLSSFNWFERIRPLDAEDVFYWRGKFLDEQLKKSNSSREVPMPTLRRNR